MIRPTQVALLSCTWRLYRTDSIKFVFSQDYGVRLWTLVKLKLHMEIEIRREIIGSLPLLRDPDIQPDGCATLFEQVWRAKNSTHDNTMLVRVVS